MDVKNGSAMLQRMISWALRDLAHVLVYIDDILAGTPVPPDTSLEDILDLHFWHVCEVLDVFRKYMLFVKGEKVNLFRKLIKFCGHILSKGQRKAAASKLEAIKKWVPEVITRITHFEGFSGFGSVLRYLYERFC